MSNQVSEYKALLETVPCNLCGADDYEVVYPPRYDEAKPDDIINTFRASGDEILIDQLVRCRNCGFQYLNPRLRQDLVLESYSQGTDKTFVSQVAAREGTFAKCLDTIERIVPQRGRILDVGTAGGSFLGVAKQRGWQVAGCELNHWLSDWGSKHYGISIYGGTLFDMKLEDASFDVVTLWDVLEHTSDAKAVLKECNRILKPGGILVINYPDINSLVGQLMGRKWVFLLSVHLYYFTLETIQKMLEMTGFQVVKHQRHWQSLELGYIFLRMKPYIPWASNLGTKVTKALHLGQAQVPYWMGQMLVLARRAD
ncbi:MAG: class I SAM-dependent methyltransferase [Xenococcaceae cyanobacterium]